MNFYNENDPHAAAWLRELIARKLIPDGVVDERSITEIRASDLSPFVQCHFFAGSGGWSLALQLAGVSADTRLWTGSCPCQPFSSAGKGEGEEDERHLWPTFFKLIEACRPPVVFGEQVASALVVGKTGGGHREENGPVWLDGVFADLESAGYATGATVLGAHSVGAPHIRQRLYWVADSIGEGLEGHRRDERDGGEPGRLDPLAAGPVAAGGSVGGLGNPPSGGLGIIGDAPRPGSGGHADGSGDASCGMGNPIDTARERDARGLPAPQEGEHGTRVAVDGRGPLGPEHAGPSVDSFWGDSVWLPCRDGKHRRVPAQSVLQPVADGLPDLVGAGWSDLLEATPGLAEAAKGFPLASSDPFKLATRGTVRPALLKGAGNAIVPQVAAEFIQAYLEVTAL